MVTLKLLAKLLSIILFISTFVAITLFFIYPQLPEIKANIEELSPYRVTQNTALSIFTHILPSQSIDLIAEINQTGTIENIPIEEIIKLRNEGKILFNMEKQDTELYIPKANIKGDVVDDETPYGLERGFWHFPLSTIPGQQGNTVIIGHRFKYMPPNTNTFFNLDKARVGDKIVINQKDGSYRYTITEKKVVEKNDRSVLLNTNDYRLTLITCTPLWTSDQRLVVIGKLDKVYGSI